jgi:hypothetical protein
MTHTFGTSFTTIYFSLSRNQYQLSYGPPWAHCLGGYQDRLLGGSLGLLELGCTAPVGVKHEDLGGGVLR